MRQATRSLTATQFGGFGFFAAFLGLLADVGTPWGDYIQYLLVGSGAVFVCAIVFLILAKLTRKQRGMSRAVARLSTVCFSFSTASALVFGLIWFAQRQLSAGGGIVAEYAPAVRAFQDRMDTRFDRLDRAIAVLTETSVESAERVEDINKTLETSLALQILERVETEKNGSRQGQAEALRSLMGEGYEFQGSTFSGVSFVGARVPGINLRESRLHFANISAADFKGADLSETGLRFAKGDRDTNLARANLSGTYAPFIDVSAADLSAANLSGANMTAGRLRGANLFKANLTGAAFAFADLRNADLRGADLTGAHFVGADLRGADLTGATLSQTNLLAAVVDEDALDDAQAAGACRHQTSGQTGGNIRLTERWESDRYPSGYEYDDLYLPGSGRFFTGNLTEKSLVPCTSQTDSAVGFNARYPYEIDFLLDRAYLAKRDRERIAQDRVGQFIDHMESLTSETRFTSGQDYREVWEADMSRAALNVESGTVPELEADTTLVLLLERGVVQPEQVNWDRALLDRLRQEEAARGSDAGDLPWAPLFPTDSQSDDLPRAAPRIFRDWTLARAETGVPDVLLRPAHVVRTAEDGSVSLELHLDSLRHRNYRLRQSHTWRRHSDVDLVNAAVGARDRYGFAPSDVRVGNVRQVMVAWPHPTRAVTLDLDAQMAGQIVGRNVRVIVKASVTDAYRVPDLPGVIVIALEADTATVTIAGSTRVFDLADK